MMEAKNAASETAGSGNPESTRQQPAGESGAVSHYHMDPTRQLSSDSADRMQGHTQCTAHQVQGDAASCVLCEQSHTIVDVESAHRVALMVTPDASESVIDQVWEAVSTIRAVLKQQPVAMTVTAQTVFLRRADDAEACRRLFAAYYGDRSPVTNFVVQPPCGGQALAIEAWALGGPGVEIRFPRPDVVTIEYDGLRWVHTGGITEAPADTAAYDQGAHEFDEVARRLKAVGATFQDVVRVWLYLGSITTIDEASGVERYRELNRARTDFFADQSAQGLLQIHRDGRDYYPASTGIGMRGPGLTVSCMALQTDREDVRLLPLENPNQTSAFNYSKAFSAKSPKFSRAMAVIIGDYITTWVSGTASIVNSETVHVGDAERQTEQTIDNIERLISRENFAGHGVADAGARLEDLAKVRVYVKRAEDYETCRAVCERRFGPIPAIYAVADVCRSDLLVEIEGVAFSRVNPNEARANEQ
ncbi:MAG: dioxygenase [Planctomycetota bacterium]|nr:MAG: dioxygenase [Planctomycetota bacterium]REK31393.1 MAG: dioxygenase [Planctomycetota bacterium]REK37347.1 MAG: dioxygenase [Planctomycetota bacterium]